MNDQNNPETSIREIHQAIDTWMEVVQENAMERLLARPSANKWSLGQLCNHLLEATDYFFNQVVICTSGNEHSEEQMSEAARIIFRNNGFPDKLIVGPPSNAATPQPHSREDLLHGINGLRQPLTEIESRLAKSNGTGKTRHPGLNHFNAREWLQFTGMHFRHHLRQKQRIEDFPDRTCI